MNAKVKPTCLSLLLTMASLIICARFLAAEAPAATTLTVDHINHIDADIDGMIQKGDYLYALEYPGSFRVYDISHPAFPEVVTTTSKIHGGAMASEGNYLYTVGGSTLRIVDISDPANPSLITTFDDFESYQGKNPFLISVAVHNQIVYVTLTYPDQGCTIYGKVAVLDATDPATPVRVGTLLGNPSGVGDLATWEDNLYVLFGSAMMRYNISTPATPTYSGEIDFMYVHHEGGHLFIEDGFAYLFYFEVSTPCYGAYAGWYIVNLANPQHRFSYPFQQRRLYTYSDGYLYSYTDEDLFQISTAPDYDVPILATNETIARNMIIKDGFLLAMTLQNAAAHGLDTFRVAADAVAVGPGQAGTLAFTDTLGLTTTIDIGAQAALSPTVASVLPLPAGPWPPVASSPPPGLRARQVFELAGYLPDDQQTLAAFQQPVTVTLPYSTTALPKGSWFAWWDGATWVDAADSCGASVAPPATASTIQQPICAAGKYALFYDPYESYLPLVAR